MPINVNNSGGRYTDEEVALRNREMAEYKKLKNEAELGLNMSPTDRARYEQLKAKYETPQEKFRQGIEQNMSIFNKRFKPSAG